LKQYKTFRQLLLLFTACCISLGCRNAAYSAGIKGSKNFSARYNYLYNAKELIRKLEEQETTDFNEDYDQILPVFKSLPLQTAAMEKVIIKANTIITEKNQSNYVDAAYLLLSKAYFYNRDYFSSLANLDIITEEYKENLEIYHQALTLKVRCLLALGSNEEALNLAQLLSDSIDGHYKNTEDSYAARAAAYMANNQSKKAISLLSFAVQESKNKEARARWTYICAQLHEQQLEFAQAVANYNKVKNSNASSALQLSAALKEITLADGAINRAAYDKSMNRLLRNADYEEHRDQIFYQLGKNAFLNKSYQIAEKYYQMAVKEKGKNTTIRGLAFSKMGDLNLYQFREYQKAEKYYDSAAISLPKTLIHVGELDRIDNLRTISSIYLSIFNEEKIKKADSNPYNQKIIDSYYEIATIYLQKVKNLEESQRIYEMLQSRFPENSYSNTINLVLRNAMPNSQTNAFVTDYQNRKFNNTIQEATDINKQRNNMLIARKPMFAIEQEKPKIVEASKPAEAVALAASKSQIEKQHYLEKIDYYFIISVSDVSMNMSPARYRLGEFNRSRYADSNLRHKLLEFENVQVIYVGIFKTMDEAKIYNDEINTQLNTIVGLPKGSYTSTIMSKENLEKLETLEILKQK